MTAVEIVYKYNVPPTETTMRAMVNVREVYGIRRLKFNESENTIRVEYDATRLSESQVSTLLRRTGLDLGDKLQLA